MRNPHGFHFGRFGTALLMVGLPVWIVLSVLVGTARGVWRELRAYGDVIPKVARFVLTGK